MARGNDLNPETQFFCEVADCHEPAVRVNGSPVYHYVCLFHADRLGLERVDGFRVVPAPTRTMPLALFVAYDERGTEVRACSLAQLVPALEEALAGDDPGEQVRGLLAAMREALAAPLEQLSPVVAPGF